jgi:copper(I)-binding protein
MRVIVSPAQADRHAHGIVVQQAWTLPAVAGGDALVFAVLTNTDHAPDTLTGASSPLARSVEMTSASGPVQAVRSHALSDLELDADSVWLRLEDLDKAVDVGSFVPIQLHFERHGAVAAEALVTWSAPTPPSYSVEPVIAPLPEDAAIRIVQPADGSTAKSGAVVVTVEIDNVPDDLVHWHTYLDRTLVAMAVGDTREVEVQIQPGEHELEVVLADARHGETRESPRDLASLTALP